MSHIKYLNIHKFRGVNSQKIKIGNRITAIVGQNGAQKSTMLGMIAQPFNFTQKKDLFNESFATKFGDIFNFDENYDAIGNHRYSLELHPESNLFKQLSNDDISININSRKRTGDLCLFTFDTSEQEFNENPNNKFMGLMLAYKQLKNKLTNEEFANRKLAKTHRKNRLSLRELLEHYKNDNVLDIYLSSQKNSDDSKVDYIIELKANSSHLRFVAGNANKTGEGNLTFPVKYLGLSRLTPLGEIDRDDIMQNEQEVLDEFEKDIALKAKDILLDYFSSDYKATALDINDTSSKGIKIGLHTEDSSPITMSAGQDNLSRILSSIYSFRYIKDHLKEEYFGGLLLIDEIDATLFPAAQKELVKFMKEMSVKLNLQIIFTTHSIHIIDELYSAHKTKDYTINYIKRTEDGLINNSNMTPETIYYDIAVQSKSKHKIPCLCEDAHGANMLKALIEESDELNSDDFEFISLDASYTFLKKLINIENKYTQHSIYVVDGDQPDIIRNLNNQNKTHTGVALPLNDPEIVLSKFLTEQIPSSHAIFTNYEYNKQQFIRDFNEHKQSSVAVKSKTFIQKLEKSNKTLFQNNCERLYSIWANWFKENCIDEFNVFIKDFKKAHRIALKKIDYM